MRESTLYCEPMTAPPWLTARSHLAAIHANEDGGAAGSGGGGARRPAEIGGRTGIGRWDCELVDGVSWVRPPAYLEKSCRTAGDDAARHVRRPGARTCVPVGVAARGAVAGRSESRFLHGIGLGCGGSGAENGGAVLAQSGRAAHKIRQLSRRVSRRYVRDHGDLRSRRRDAQALPGSVAGAIRRGRARQRGKTQRSGSLACREPARHCGGDHRAADSRRRAA